MKKVEIPKGCILIHTGGSNTRIERVENYPNLTELDNYIIDEETKLVNMMNQFENEISEYKRFINNPNNLYKSINISTLEKIKLFENKEEPNHIKYQRSFIDKLYQQKHELESKLNQK